MSEVENLEASACLASPTSINTKIFPESSFFQERRGSTLPSPAEVRALNEASGHDRATSFNRPCPVVFPSLDMIVKYGADVTINEAETQALIRQLLHGQVPIPEVFGWAEERKQTFIYMAWVKGDTLQTRFANMDENERQAVCNELKGMVVYLTSTGSINKRPLNDIFVYPSPELAGLFLGSEAVQKFHDACDVDIGRPNPRVVAILDWGQSGWYPWYWEYCKAKRVGRLETCFVATIQEGWHTKYLPLIIDPVDDELYYHPWLYFMISKI
ncbi:hypothetical protein BKA67DRAFT_636987 [Truncatella angustata]|uniref:Aminoglycoside phosphotransferase domain-containing protein n=1 Tax=Truncatella angustata TaxID=152316 RepID=A0A9P8UMH1_9PEZI|nr:uncharacterized protein BKA67DRAFT_636987 [Truncatella angustata]KAH6654898.1 hypothetical protein BKA67DRAFT_636987 [Truncatella angustata]